MPDTHTDKPDDDVDYEDLIEDQIEAPLKEEVAVEEVGDTTHAKRRPPLWPFLILLGALLGFGASFAATYYTRPAPFDPAPLRAEYERKIASLTAEIEALRNRPAPRPQTVDLTPLETRIEALENAPPPEILAPSPEIDEALVSRLEALKADGFDVAPAPDLAPLETQLEQIIARLEALEDRPPILEATLPEIISEDMVVDESVADIEVSVPAFPSDILRDGAEARRGGGLFSKHFRIRSDDDPLTLIEGIEADLEDERYAMALAKFDQLPPELQNLARGWRADMESVLETQTP